jgi:hypothetical protein
VELHACTGNCTEAPNTTTKLYDTKVTCLCCDAAAANTKQVGLEHSNHKWLAVGWPQRIQQQCQDSSHLAQACRAAFGDEMGGDQDRFARAIELLDMEV